MTTTPPSNQRVHGTLKLSTHNAAKAINDLVVAADPDTVYNENDLVGHRFEAQTEQREDPNQKKLDGTRIAYETIGAIPDRSGKKKSKESDLTPEEEAQMEGALSKS